MDVYKLIGSAGAILILFGLYRTVSGAWTAKSLWYELDHFLGSLLLVIYLLHEREYLGVFINAAYAFVVFSGLSSYAERRAFHHGKKHKRRT